MIMDPSFKSGLVLGPTKHNMNNMLNNGKQTGLVTNMYYSSLQTHERKKHLN